jgi:beta-mannosidase
VVDSLGRPKAAWHALKRAFRPVQVALTDEGVNGLGVQLINETAETVDALLTLTCLRHSEHPVARAERPVSLPARSALTLPSSALFDAFFDITYAYRFGPAQHDTTVAVLSDASGRRLADAFHFPTGYPLAPAELGLIAEVRHDRDGWSLALQSRRVALSVHVEDDRFRAAEEWFHLAPGAERVLRLLPREKVNAGAVPDGEVHALNTMVPVRFKGPARGKE